MEEAGVAAVNSHVKCVHISRAFVKRKMNLSGVCPEYLFTSAVGRERNGNVGHTHTSKMLTYKEDCQYYEEVERFSGFALHIIPGAEREKSQ